MPWAKVLYHRALDWLNRHLWIYVLIVTTTCVLAPCELNLLIVNINLIIQALIYKHREDRKRSFERIRNTMEQLNERLVEIKSKMDELNALDLDLLIEPEVYDARMAELRVQVVEISIRHNELGRLVQLQL